MEVSMKTKLAVFLASMAMLTVAVPIAAHHSFAAEFDATKAVKLTGAVTKIEWQNPHTYFYIDVTEICEGAPAAAGQQTAWKCAPADKAKAPNWGLEMGSPNGLMRQGWTRNSMKIGDVVTVEGSAAKDGSNIGNARTVMVGGQRLFAGSSQTTTP
jgi:hypothetical protein